MGTKATKSLIESAQRGDIKAMSALLATTQADARRYARRHCHASDVDDAVQESLLIISRKVTALKVAAAFSSWLFTVIRRECQKLQRMMFRHVALDHDIAETLLQERSPDSLRLDQARALRSLPAHYLDVILMRDFEELTIAEISSQLNVSVGAVKSRLHRARELIRESLISTEGY
ncbi:sigma-70 family RNA polymerase sigma factor [Escherichia coli]|nr:sigma-70 family RNA polymerase sigma factor [Escherichia coli]